MRFIDEIALGLLKLKEYDNAYKVLYKRYQIQPNDLSAKWLGQISLNKGDTKKAVKFLEEAVRYDSEDLQALYNLAGAYALNKDYKKSYDVITKVLMKEPNYPGAQNLINQLKVRGVL